MTGRQEVDRLRRRLDATFSRAPTAYAEVELQSDFAKYLCVLVCGYLETAIVALVLDYAERRSAPDIASFVERRLDRWASPTSDKISELLGAFDGQWRKSAEAFFVDRVKDSINSLVALRHRIAHGESVGTSLSQIKEYRKGTDEVVEFVAQLLGC